MSAASTVYGIVVRDLSRTTRQTGRLLGGLVRPFIWFLLVGTGYDAITRLEGGLSYRAFVYPGVLTMAVLFGAMLTAIGTVYDREFGMLRLMLASPAGTGTVLLGRSLAAALVGLAQGIVVLLFAPLVVPVSAREFAAGLGALAAAALSSSVLGLLVAARLRSVENFAGIINVVLFPLLFVSGALYPTGGMPAALRGAARVNPVTYQVDLVRHALGQPAEFPVPTDVGALAAATVVAFVLTIVLFDPEQRLVGRRRLRRLN